ncbi:antibiotic biosynthesis monooxygenase [Gordonia sp. TBRC 11910]|uniref:Antibiotic biosynthesis monooxygenase n=1 Tax=Gordonia asplenii TaxID=2725283 RepID=A0A848L8D4_9ACTN|nr:antibiotic biosynthesis monooxygenase [Gordonia asplenii]NMO05013.1 antibiotic biosynthesis monooxygenase [Gordonia asplenii]
MSTHDPSGATMIIGQRIVDGRESDYQRWQRGLSDAAAEFPGFVGADLRPPTAVQPEWVVVYQFDSVSHLQDWLNSRVRSAKLEEGADLFDGPGTAQLVSAGHREPDTLVTVVVSHRVAPESIDDFLAWQKRLDAAERAFPGFCGSELFRPIDGVHDEWTISYRYDSAEHLDAWLTSDRRREMLAEAEQFGDFTLRTIDHSFGNWFSFGYDDRPPPSNFKSSIAVWMGLYPTVVLLTLLTSPLGMPLWLGMLIGNLLSSLSMSYFTMPYYVNRILGWWLKPRRDAPQPTTDWRGFGLVLAVNAFWVLVFYLVTVVIWSLP